MKAQSKDDTRWALGGELIMTIAPGPRLVAAACYAWSPVGPYLEMAMAEPARVGVRPGIRVTTMAVSSSASCQAGRLHWGFPKELATLHWDVEGDERCFRWDEQGIDLRATPLGPPLPVVLPGWAVQERSGEPVTVPLRLRGRLRAARMQITARTDGVLSHLGGSRPGVILTHSRLVVGPARPSCVWTRTAGGEGKSEPCQS